MNVVEATKDYEKWVAQYITLVKPDIEFKHEQMRTTPFAFLRATFYRWMQLQPKTVKGYKDTPKLLAVGDLHVENFGTWRDAEGRLIWGVNDFDEADLLPYTVDLIRTATSIHFAIKAGELSLDFKTACDALEEGYRRNLEGTGVPFVLAEKHAWLRKAATGELRDPIVFWKKMGTMPDCTSPVPTSAVTAIEEMLPAPTPKYEIKTRRAGLGSLGHQRYVAMADITGGQIAREVKALAQSGVRWAAGEAGPLDIRSPAIIRRAVRARDPLVAYHGQWQVRRLAPYCSRVELSELSKERDEEKLIEAMGFETANIHQASPDALKAVKKHLKDQPRRWLIDAAMAMAEKVEDDFENYRKSG